LPAHNNGCDRSPDDVPDTACRRRRRTDARQSCWLACRT